MAITHALVADGDPLVGADDWNADHEGSGLPPPWSLSDQNGLTILPLAEEADIVALTLAEPATTDGFSFLKLQTTSGVAAEIALVNGSLVETYTGRREMFDTDSNARVTIDPFGNALGPFPATVLLATGNLGRTSDVAHFMQGEVASALTLTFGSTGDIVFIPVLHGVDGNDISITLLDPGAPDIPLSVMVTDLAIEVTLATDGGGVITSLASEVSFQISTDAAYLVSAFTNTDGLAEATSETFLTGGLDTEDVLVVTGSGLVELSTRTADPSAGGGVAGNIGSLYSRDNAGTGELWFKTGPADTDWTQVV